MRLPTLGGRASTLGLKDQVSRWETLVGDQKLVKKQKQNLITELDKQEVTWDELRSTHKCLSPLAVILFHSAMFDIYSPDRNLHKALHAWIRLYWQRFLKGAPC